MNPVYPIIKYKNIIAVQDQLKKKYEALKELKG